MNPLKIKTPPATATRDVFFMTTALNLAAQGRWTTRPNPCVGCVIVQNNEIIGEGHHQQAGAPHAEVFALRQAGLRAKGATLYVTLEPCNHYGRTPPCTEQIIAAGIRRVVAASVDPNPLVAGIGIARLRDAGIHVDVGCQQAEAQALNIGFITRMTQKRPFVSLKLAATLDGRTALANGASKWITSIAARQDVQQHRAASCAILTGADTLLADDSALTVRPQELPETIATDFLKAIFKQPWRLFTDSQNRIPSTANIYKHAGRIIRISNSDNPDFSIHDNLWNLPKTAQGHTDLKALLKVLGQAQCNRLWIECGATLAGVFIQEKLVDEIIVYIAGKLMGQHARPLVHLNPIAHMQDTSNLVLQDLKRIGNDVKLTYTLE